MPQVPLLRPRGVVRAFGSLGWQVVRQRGSHILLTKPGNVATLSAPDHALVARGTLRALIAKAGLFRRAVRRRIEILSRMQLIDRAA